ncbi:hypothetical protein GQ53DRAFT_747758 [Thozetella sp. PMI_491]|nr:hypothetical protein GQ53DRAFT_747758 [Thozetella sp. PMI_491]
MQFSQLAAFATFVTAALAAPAVSEPNTILARACTPGDYGCEGRPSGTSGKILTCNAAGVWVLSSECGAGRCRETNGNPFCV